VSLIPVAVETVKARRERRAQTPTPRER
jgi:hypothetical protein